MQPINYVSPQSAPSGVILSQPVPSGDGCCRRAAPYCSGGCGVMFIILGVLCVAFSSWGINRHAGNVSDSVFALFEIAVISGCLVSNIFTVVSLYACHLFFDGA